MKYPKKIVSHTHSFALQPEGTSTILKNKLTQNYNLLKKDFVLDSFENESGKIKLNLLDIPTENLTNITHQGQYIGRALRQKNQIKIELEKEINLEITGEAEESFLHIITPGDLTFNAEIGNNTKLNVIAQNAIFKKSITTDEVNISLLNTLVVKRSLQAKKVNIAAEVIINNSIISAQKIKCIAKNKIENNKEIISYKVQDTSDKTYITLLAPTVIDNGNISSEGKLKIDCQNLQTNETATISAKNKFKYSGNSLDNCGTLSFTSEAFFNLNSLHNKGLIKLPETAYLQATNILIDGNGKIDCTKNNGEVNSTQSLSKVINVDGKIKVTKNAQLTLNGANLTAQKLSVTGEFNADHSAIHIFPAEAKPNVINKPKRIKSISAKGDGKIQVSQSWIESKVITSNSSQKVNFDNSAIDTSIMRLNSPIKINKCTINSQLIDINSAAKVDDTQIINTGNLIVNKAGNLQVENSFIDSRLLKISGEMSLSADKNAQFISKMANIEGNLNIRNSYFKTEILDAKTNSTLKVQNNSTLDVTASAQFHGAADLSGSYLRFGKLSNYGTTSIKNSRLISDSAISSENSLLVDDVAITSPSLDLGGNYQIENLISVDDKDQFSGITDINQSGNGIIRKSRLRTELLMTEKNANLQYEDNGKFEIAYGILSGEIAFKTTEINSDNLYQLNSALTIENCPNIHIADHLSSDQQSSLKIINSNIDGNKILLDGDLQAQDYSFLTANEINLAGDSNLKTSQLTAKRDLIASGELNFERTIIKADKFRANAKISGNNGKLETKNLEVLTEGDIHLKNIVVETKDSADIFGPMQLEQGNLTVDKDLNIYHKLTNIHAPIKVGNRVHVNAKGALASEDTKIEAHQAEINNDFIGKNSILQTTGDVVMEFGANVKADNLFIKSQGNIQNSVTSKINGSTLSLSAKSMENAGEIELEKAFIADIDDFFENTGTIEGGELAKIDVNGVISNEMGSISADTVMQTGALSINYFGNIHGRDNLISNSLLDLNFLGLRHSYNMSVNSLYSLNAGLMLPGLPKNISAIFSPQHFLAGGKALLTMMLPQAALPINLGFMLVPKVWSISKTAWDIGITGEKNWNDIFEIENFRLKDALPTFLQYKSLALTGISAFHSSQKLYNDITSTSEENWVKNFNWDFIKKNHGFSCETVINSVGAILGPTMSSEAIINKNIGILASQNVSQNDWLSYNAGMQFGLQSYAHNTHTMFNTGVTAALDLNLQGTTLKNQGALAAENKTFIQFNDIDLSKSKFFSVKNGIVRGNNLTMGGLLYYKNMAVAMDKEIKLYDTANLNAKDTTISGKDIFLSGTINYSGHLAFICENDLDFENCNIKVEGDGEMKKIVIPVPVSEPNATSSQPEAKSTETGTEEVTQTDVEKPVSRTLPPGESSKENETKENESSVKEGEVNGPEIKDSNTKETQETNTAQNKEKTEKIEPKNFLFVKAKNYKMKGNVDIVSDGALFKGSDIQFYGNNNFKSVQFMMENSAVIEKNAQINAINSFIESHDLEHNGKINYSGYFGVKTKESTVVTGSGEIHGDKQEGTALVIEGKHVYLQKDSKIDATAFHIQGETVDINSEMDLKNGKIIGSQELVIGQDANLIMVNVEATGHDIEVHGKIEYEGYLGIKAENALTKTAPSSVTVKENNGKNYCEMVGDHGDLAGYVDADNLSVRLKNMPDAADLVERSGKYEDTHVSHMLNVVTQDGIHLNKQINRDCGLDLEGHSIDFNTKYKTDKNVILKSTVGDIYIQKDLKARNIAAESAASLYTKQNVHADEKIYFKAKQSYCNIGGNITGDEVAVQAAEVKNITKGSDIYKNLDSNLQKEAGNGGIIAGRKVYIEAVKDNVENHGGVLKGQEFLQIVAEGDVLNIANVKTEKGKHGIVKTFDPAVINGGDGKAEGCEDVGLYIQAKGKFKNIGSVVQSQGTNCIEAKQGIESIALHHTYISEKGTKRSFLSKKKTEKTQTNVQNAQFISTEGKNVLIAEEGKILGVATDFLSKNGTEAFAKGNIELYSLKYTDSKKTKRESFGGLNKSKKHEKHENAVPVVIYDEGITRLESAQGSIIGKGVVALGDGDFITLAKNGSVKFSSDTLQHSVNSESKSIGLSSSAIDKIQSLKHDGIKGLLNSADPILQKTEKLLKSSDGYEFMANTWNTGIAGYNLYQNVQFAAENKALAELALKQAGMDDLLNPSVGVSYKKEKSSIKYETNGPGGIQRKSWIGEAKDDVTTEGMDVNIRKNASFKAKRVAFNGKELHSETERSSGSITINATPSGPSTGVTYAENKGEATRYQNCSINIGGNLHLETEKLEIAAANIECQTISGNATVIEITSEVDTYESKSKNGSLNSAGQFTFFTNKTKGAQVNYTTTLHVRDGINHDPNHTFTVESTINTGAKITTDGINNFKSTMIVNHDVHDFHKEKSLGVSGNLNDLQQIFAEDLPVNPGEPKLLKTMNIATTKKNYRATQTATYYGKQGGNIDYEKNEGKMNINDDSGYKIKKNSRQELSVDIPLMNLPAMMQEIKPTKLPVQSGDIEKMNADLLQEENKINIENQDEIKKDQEENTEKSACRSADLQIELDINNNELFDDEKLFSLLQAAEAEYALNQQLSPETEEKLNNEMVALIKTTKAGGRAGLKKITDMVEPDIPKNVKIHLKSPGYLLTFGFNVALASGKDMLEVMGGALSLTFANLTTSKVITHAFKGTAGFVSWALLGNDVLDYVIYDEAKIEESVVRQDESRDNMRKALRNGDFFGFFGEQALLNEESESISTCVTSHKIAEATRATTEKIANLCPFGNSKIDEAEEKTVKP